MPQGQAFTLTNFVFHHPLGRAEEPPLEDKESAAVCLGSDKIIIKIIIKLVIGLKQKKEKDGGGI